MEKERERRRVFRNFPKAPFLSFSPPLSALAKRAKGEINCCYYCVVVVVQASLLMKEESSCHFTEQRRNRAEVRRRAEGVHN